MSTDQRSDVYFKVYSAQKGGELPAYRGSRKIQYGSGFGDILRSVNRHVLPVTAERVSTIAPPCKPVLEPVANTIAENVKGQAAMSGSGKRKRKHKKKKSSKKKTVYKGKKRRSKKRKVFVSESANIPNFNF